MHEFSIAQHIIDIALQSAKHHHADQIVSVEVEIGRAAGVVVDALKFAWESSIKDTPLQDAALVIKTVPIVAVCKSCRKQYNPVELFDICPQCAEINPEILQGKEMRVSAIIINN